MKRIIALCVVAMVAVCARAHAEDEEGVAVLTIDQWAWIVENDQLASIGVQLFENGEEKPVTMVEDEAIIAELIAGVDVGSKQRDGYVSADARVPVYIKTREGRMFGFQVSGLDSGAKAVFHLADGTMFGSAKLNTVFGKITKNLKFSVQKAFRASFRKAAAASGGTVLEFPEPPDADTKVEYNVIVYRDFNDSTFHENWVNTYVSLRAASGTAIVSGKASSPKGVADAFANRPEGSCIKNLAFIVHGSPAQIQMGDPENEANWVGLNGPPQVLPKTFGASIKPAMCSGAKIQLLACGCATVGIGRDMLQQLADTSGATVYGRNYVVTLRASDRPLPRAWTEETLESKPGGGAPKVWKTGLHDIDVIP